MRYLVFAAVFAAITLAGCTIRERTIEIANENLPPGTPLNNALKSYYQSAQSGGGDDLYAVQKELEYLIEGKGADVNLADKNDVLPISIALSANDAAMIDRLCKAGANPNAQGLHSLPILTIALQEGALEGARSLLRNGANPNAGARETLYPLTIAVLGSVTSGEYKDIALMLLDRGANPNLGSIADHSLLIYAAKTMMEDLAIRMTLKGADVDLADDSGLTALDWAIILKEDRLVDALLLKGAKGGASDIYGYTPVAWAIFADNARAMAALANAGWTPNEGDRGFLAAQIAKTRTLGELKALLLEKATLTRTETNAPNIVRFKDMEFITVEYSGKEMSFKTADRLLKHFVLTSPDRLVLDFSRSHPVPTFTLSLAEGTPFKQITVGRHQGYYRLVIGLDKTYQYSVAESPNGTIVTLR
ncbi:MAG: AMIN domain-containing protein [Helicobacteraceae bacterium]|jgi:ankyrin repeat protein|nr:AMIN domain-containing protein [Helicobacteraceae bacterium]